MAWHGNESGNINNIAAKLNMKWHGNNGMSKK
jgi:hypothetical protein